MRSWTMARVVFAAALIFASAGCSTPKSVADLSKTTATNVSLVNSSLEAFKADRARSAELRRQYIEEVAQTARELDSDFYTQLSAKAIVEDQSKQKAGKTVSAFARELMSDLDARIQRERTNNEKAEALTNELKRSYASLTISTDQLKKLAKALSALGAKQSLNDRLKFLTGFLKDAYKNYQENEKSSEEDSKKANADAASKSTALEAEAKEPAK